jgi:hypothetical protein
VNPPEVNPRLIGTQHSADHYESKGGPPAHRCRPPGWWRRWRDGVRPGAIWRCACGERYEFRPGELVYRSMYQAGQELAPWWHLFDAPAHPPPPRAGGL